MNKLVSIIVPVYNVKKYLSDCVDSIIKQSYSNIEILLIDDKSTDGSSELCDLISKLDNRIIVVHKEINEGLGFARNTGLDNASGDYIVFVDSDDYIENNMIEVLMNNLSGNQVDTVFCGFNKVLESGCIIPDKPCYDNEIFRNKDIIYKVLLEMVGSEPEEKEDCKLAMSVWHAIYSKSIIDNNNVRFVSEREIMSEDIIFHIDYLKCAKNIYFISDCLYNYRFNGDSLSRKFDPTRFERQKVLYNYINLKLDCFLEEEDYRNREDRKLLGGARGQIQ